MAYTKNHDPWISSDVFTTAIMNNFESIYTEAVAHITSHIHDDLYQTKSEMEAAYWYAGNDGSGTGSDADLIYYATGNLHAASFQGMGAPTGLIIMWSGGSVPSGWHLCDGLSGTRDLKNKFVVGAGTGSGYSVGDTGTGVHPPYGNITITGHALTVAEILGHQHYYLDAAGWGGTSGQYVDGAGMTRPTGIVDTLRTTTNSNIGQATADAHGHPGSTFNGNNFTVLPPYYALAYIQKI